MKSKHFRMSKEIAAAFWIHLYVQMEKKCRRSVSVNFLNLHFNGKCVIYYLCQNHYNSWMGGGREREQKECHSMRFFMRVMCILLKGNKIHKFKSLNAQSNWLSLFLDICVYNCRIDTYILGMEESIHESYVLCHSFWGIFSEKRFALCADIVLGYFFATKVT